MKILINQLSLMIAVLIMVTAQIHGATFSVSNNASDAIKDIKMNLTLFCANQGAGKAEIDRRRSIKMKMDQRIQILEDQAKAQKNSAMIQAVQALSLQVQALGKAAIEQDLDSIVALGNKVSMKLNAVETMVAD